MWKSFRQGRGGRWRWWWWIRPPAEGLGTTSAGKLNVIKTRVHWICAAVERCDSAHEGEASPVESVATQQAAGFLIV